MAGQAQMGGEAQGKDGDEEEQDEQEGEGGAGNGGGDDEQDHEEEGAGEDEEKMRSSERPRKPPERLEPTQDPRPKPPWMRRKERQPMRSLDVAEREEESEEEEEEGWESEEEEEDRDDEDDGEDGMQAEQPVSEVGGLQLHLSSKSATGYKNVYRSGRKYEARMNGGGVFLGTFETAQVAAETVARYRLNQMQSLAEEEAVMEATVAAATSEEMAEVHPPPLAPAANPDAARPFP